MPKPRVSSIGPRVDTAVDVDLLVDVGSIAAIGDRATVDGGFHAVEDLAGQSATAPIPRSSFSWALLRTIVPMLRAIGASVSIDDFGTGYSSLSALADITTDEVKIDCSFITDIHKRPRNQSILCAIESLSRALGMTVIAEGIESFEELAYLQAATEIRFARGYYFAKLLFVDSHAGDKPHHGGGPHRPAYDLVRWI